MTIDPIFIIKFLASFLFYFIGGYLLYASLFAAIGAAVDNETDSQQFLTPLSIILVIGLYIGFAAMKSPELPDGILEFVDPVHLTDRYAGPYPLRSTDLGNPDLYGIINRQFYLFYLAIRKNLPHRYFNVWQKKSLGKNFTNG